MSVEARSVAEWIGRGPDDPVPPRVRLRVFDRAKGCCQICTRKIRSGERWVADHIKAIINGGENRERNLQLICDWCDRKVKTPADSAEKAKTYAKRCADLGLKQRKGRPMPGTKASGIKQKLDGTWVDRRTGKPISKGNTRYV